MAEFTRRGALLGVGAAGVAAATGGVGDAVSDVADIATTTTPIDLGAETAAECAARLGGPVNVNARFPQPMPDFATEMQKKCEDIIREHGFSPEALNVFGRGKYRPENSSIVGLKDAVDEGHIFSRKGTTTYPMDDLEHYSGNMSHLLDALKLVTFIRACERSPNIFEAFKEIAQVVAREHADWEEKRTDYAAEHDEDFGVFEKNPFDSLQKCYGLLLEDSFSLSGLADKAEAIVRRDLAVMSKAVAKDDTLKTQIAVLQRPSSGMFDIYSAEDKDDGDNIGNALSVYSHHENRSSGLCHAPVFSALAAIAVIETLDASFPLSPIKRIEVNEAGKIMPMRVERTMEQASKAIESAKKSREKLRDAAASATMAYLARNPIEQLKAPDGAGDFYPPLADEEKLATHQAEIAKAIGLPDYIFANRRSTSFAGLRHPLAKVAVEADGAVNAASAATSCAASAVKATQRAVTAVNAVAVAANVLSQVAKQLEPVERDPDISWEATLKDITPEYETPDDKIITVYQLPAPEDGLEQVLVDDVLRDMGCDGVEVVRSSKKDEPITLIISDNEVARSVSGARRVSSEIGGRVRAADPEEA